MCWFWSASQFTDWLWSSFVFIIVWFVFPIDYVLLQVHHRFWFMGYMTFWFCYRFNLKLETGFIERQNRDRNLGFLFCWSYNRWLILKFILPLPSLYKSYTLLLRFTRKLFHSELQECKFCAFSLDAFWNLIFFLISESCDWDCTNAMRISGFRSVLLVDVLFR